MLWNQYHIIAFALFPPSSQTLFRFNVRMFSDLNLAAEASKIPFPWTSGALMRAMQRESMHSEKFQDFYKVGVILFQEFSLKHEKALSL